MEENISRRQHQRIPFDAKVEFFVDADIVAAETEDISASGVRITSAKPVKAFLRVTEADGTTKEYQAEMVWARRDLGKGMTFGLEFIEEEGLEIVSF